MCGQFGILLNKRSLHADDFISDAFTASMLRGFDSSGMASIDIHTGMSIIHKLPVMGSFFAQDSLAKALIGDAAAAKTLTMCHVRAATVGRISLSNAHPFEICKDGKTVIGTHNGTLTGWATKPGARPYSVDSEWALNHIHEEGYDAFENFTGAYSFVWWDSERPDVLNMARNNQRPMSVCFLKEGGMAYASEPGMLYWLLERNHMKPEPGSIIELSAGKWYKFKAEEPQNFTTVDLPAPTTYSTTTMYGGRYSTSSTNSYSLTTIDKVNKIIARVTKEAATTSVETTEPVVYESEVKAAREYGWLDEDVEFTPLEYREETDTTLGLVDAMDTTFDGCIRGDLSKFPWTHTWHCRVLGLQDDSNELVMVLSKPFKTTQPVPVEQ